jgi:AraC-like DNA-binding protein
MDKINLANWSNIFSTTKQQVIFASGRYTDVHFQFEEPGLVSGFVKTVAMPGMELTEFSLDAGRPMLLVDENSKESAESVFVLDGASESHFNNIGVALQCNKNQHNFQYNSEFGGKHMIHSSTFHALSITYDLSFLKQVLQNQDGNSIGKIADCVHGQKTFVANNNALASQLRMTATIASMQQNSFTGAMRYLFLESKMMELFALQLQQMLKPDSSNQQRWSAGDIEKMHALKNYIEENYLEEFTLKDLTFKFSLNEFKLKKGYKQLFGTTVFGHVYRLRMQKAKTLLEERAMNVSEAGFFIGYDNVSSFCAAFKQRFGYSPGKLNSVA